MKIRVDLFHETVTVILPKTPIETKSFSDLGWEIPESISNDKLMKLIKEYTKNSTKKIEKIIIWPKKLELNFVEEQPGFYKTVYKVKGQDKFYCLLEEGKNKNWYSVGTEPCCEADCKIHPQYPDRFIISRKKPSGKLKEFDANSVARNIQIDLLFQGKNHLEN